MKITKAPFYLHETQPQVRKVRSTSSNTQAPKEPKEGAWHSVGQVVGKMDAKAPPLEDMKAKELKGLLKEKGLSTRGTKAQLVARLSGEL